MDLNCKALIFDNYESQKMNKMIIITDVIMD